MARDHDGTWVEGRTVLIVEDNEANRLLALRQLRVLGYRAKAVRGGEEAVAAVASERYRLILMDCQMPGMDGLEATRQIRKGPGLNPPIPIIAMTANATEHDRQRCLEAGMDDYLTKPVLLDALRETLGRWIPGPGDAAIDGSKEVQQAPSTDGDGIDGAALLRLEQDVGVSAASRFVARYLEELPDRTEAIANAIVAQDPAALAFAAHTLRSTSATIGAAVLAGLCEEVESIGRRGTTSGADERLRQIEEVSDRVEQALRRREESSG